MDKIKTEQKAIDLMADHGITYQVPRGKLIGIIKRKPLEFTLRHLKWGTQIEMAKHSLEMNIEDVLKDETNPELLVAKFKGIISHSSKPLSLYLATAILNDKGLIPLRKKVLAKRLIWSLTPKQMLDLTMVILSLSNMADFMNSIRLSGGLRVTIPQEKETDKPNLSPEDHGG